MLFLLLIFFNTEAGGPPPNHINDYQLVNIAGNALRSGMDLYDPHQWERAHQLFAVGGYIDNPVFIYPLPFAFFFVPFSFLSIPVGEVAWLLFGEGFLIFCAAALLRGIDTSKPWRLAFLAICIGIFLPVINVWWARQHTFLLFLFLTLAFVFMRDRKDGAAGVMLALLALRPGAVLYLIPAVLVWAALKQRWRIWFASGLTGLGLLAVSWMIRPGWPAVWFDYTVGGRGKLYSYVAYVPTLWGMLTDFNIPTTALGKVITGITITVLMLAFSAWWLWRHKQSSITAVVLLFVPASLFLSFYAWNYDQLFLLLPLLLILVAAENLPELKTRIWALTLFTMAVWPYVLRAIALARGRDSLSALLPLAVWALGLWIIRESNGNPRQVGGRKRFAVPSYYRELIGKSLGRPKAFALATRERKTILIYAGRK